MKVEVNFFFCLHLQNEKKKINETLHKLNDAVTLVEQQLEESKRQQDRLFAAEIQSRSPHLHHGSVFSWLHFREKEGAKDMELVMLNIIV